MNSKVFTILGCLVYLARAEDLSNGSEGTNVEIAKGYSFNSMIDASGKPAGSLHAYLGGKLSQVPPQPTYYTADGTYLAPSPTSIWLSQFTSASYFVAGVVAALSLWYIISIAVPATKKSVDDLLESKAADGAKDADKGKSRRRRAIRKEDDEMTRLATIVLTAVQSGECLQKSICLMGSQVSTKRGRLADSLLSTLLPTSIQQSDYYIILRKSLRGEVSCERFACPH